MAYIQDQTEQQNNQANFVNPTNAPSAPQTSVSTGDTGGGGSKGGVSSTGANVTGPSANAPAQGGTAQQAPAFTNLQTFVQQNQPATQNLAGNIANNISNSVNTANQNINQGSNVFNQDVNAGTVFQNQNLLNEVATSPTSITNSPSALQQFQNQFSGTYTGPNSFNADSNVNQGSINQSIQNAQGLAANVGTASGREQLIGSAEQGNSPTLAYSQPSSTGNLSFNNALLQNTYPALQTVQQAAAPASQISGNLQNANTQAANAVTNAQNTTTATNQAAQQAVTNATNNLQNTVTGNVTNLQNQATVNQQVLSAALQSGTQLTPAALQAIGLTQPQYQNLLNLEQQLGNTEGAANNLAALGANALLGSQYAASLGGATVANPTGAASTIQQVLGGAGSLVGGLSAANTISNLISAGSSAISPAAQAAAAAYDAMTPAEQVAADIAGEGAASIGGSTIGNIAAQAAASDATSLAASAGTMLADSLPLIGGALTLGNIISTGQWGNGQGGVSGGLAGGMQGASLGAAIGSIIPGVGTLIGGIIGGIAGFIGGLFGGGQQSNFQVTTLNVNNGQLSMGTSSGDRTNPAASAAAAQQAVTLINQLCAQNGLQIVNTGARENGNSPLGIYGGTHGSIGNGMAVNAAGLWAFMIQNNMVQPIPGSALAQSAPQALDLSSFLTATNPTVNITAANVASQQQYQDYAALNQLGGTNGTFLQQQNIGQAGTATPYADTFNYQTALTQLQNDINNAQATDITQNQNALSSLEQAGYSQGEGH